METPKSTSTELVASKKTPIIGDERGLKLKSLDEIWRFAMAVVNSGIYRDISTPEIAVVRIQAGMELGLTPIWALSNIMTVNGRCSVWGDALLGIVLAHPECEDVVETFEGGEKTDDYTAVCEVHRKGRLPVKRTFSVGDAKKAGLWGKNVWASHPNRMLQMRARSWACRDAFADALRGLGVVEELRDVSSQPDKEQIKREVKAKLVLPDETVIDQEGDPVERKTEPEPVAAKPRSGDELFPTGDES
jgi:hypothetical protein